MNYWLMKTEPATFGIDHLARRPRKTAMWDGVRNYQARNMLRDDFRKGDLAFLYHSSCEIPGIAGVMTRGLNEMSARFGGVKDVLGVSENVARLSDVSVPQIAVALRAHSPRPERIRSRPNRVDEAFCASVTPSVTSTKVSPGSSFSFSKG